MTPNELIGGVRFLLGDAERQSDTGAQFYATPVIERALTDSLAQLVHDLILPPRGPDDRSSGNGERVKRAAVTIAPLLYAWNPVWTTSGGVTSAPVPDDFFLLECGSLPTSQALSYVPVVDAGMGETLAGLTVKKLYAAGGKLYGPQVTIAYYWQRPPTIVASDVALGYFADAVYHCAKYLACRDTVIQESKTARHRWAFFDNEYQTQKGLLF